MLSTNLPYDLRLKTEQPLTRILQSSDSPVSPSAGGSTTARPASPKPPGGPATAIRRRAAADRADKVANARPSSTRAAGAGGSSSTMLKLYTDESPGLKVDPFVVMVLSIGFIISVVALHSEYIKQSSPLAAEACAKTEELSANQCELQSLQRSPRGSLRKGT